MTTRRPLADAPVPVRFKLSALWASVMFCYVYGDFFTLFKPGRLAAMLAGQTGAGPATQGTLLAFAVLMSVPAAMIFLTLALKAPLSRWMNIVFGGLFTALMILIIPGTWAFYLYMGIVEAVLTALIVWLAWRWPRA
jgi:hypothetical protein